jgi:replication factor C subunit 3/5
MTYDAQFALRRVVEIYTDSTRFCLICNYLTKIIPALQSRCQMFRFAPINNNDHLLKINKVIEIEDINIEEKAKEKIVELSDGDMRKSLNLLQSLFMINNNNLITLNYVYKSIGYPTEEEKEEIISSLSDKNLNTSYQLLNRLQIEKNLSNHDIVREISSYYGRTFLQNKKKITNDEQNRLLDMFDNLATIEINLSNNSNGNIQLLAISSVINNYNQK